MNDLEAMRVFARVAELGSFVRAAEALGIPKSSASAAVQQLEASLQTQLLHRTTRKVSLSRDGEVCFQRCLDLLADYDELTSMFRPGPQALSGRVRVGMSSGLAARLIQTELPGFLSAHPELEIELSSTERRVDVVQEGFDFVVRTGGVVDESLVARHLGVLPIVSVASASYLKARGRPRSIAELAGHRVVQFVANFGTRPEGFEYVDEAGVHHLPLEGALTVSSGDAYVAACRAGLGIIQVPRLAVQAHLQSGELMEILPEYPAEPMPVTILYARRRHLPRRVQVFMAWVGEQLAPYLD